MRLLAVATLLLVSLAARPVMAVELAPIFRLTDAQYAAFVAATENRGKVSDFTQKLKSDIKLIQRELDAGGAKNENLKGGALTLGAISLEAIIDSAAGGPVAVAVTAGVLGAVNLIAQPIIFASTKGAATIFVANATYEPMTWKRDVYVPHGTLTYAPAELTIPGRNDEGVAVGLFGFEKRFGTVGTFGIIQFDSKANGKFMVGQSVPYRDDAAIDAQNQMACRFVAGTRAARDYIYENVLDADKDVGIATARSRVYLDKRETLTDLRCRNGDTEGPATTILVNLSQEQLATRRTPLGTKRGDAVCVLEAGDAPRKKGELQTLFPAKFNCQPGKAASSGALYQDRGFFYARIGREFCPLTTADAADLGVTAALDGRDRVAAFDCEGEPLELSAQMTNATLKLSAEIGGRSCGLHEFGGQAMFDCADPDGDLIFVAQ